MVHAVYIILFIALLISLIAIIKYIVSAFKSIKDDILEVIFWYLIIAISFPFIVYYLDKYNIPTLFKFANGINTNGWLEFLGNYVATIIATMLSAVFLVYVTSKQFEASHKASEEQHRIQNLPLLQYTFDDDEETRNVEYVSFDVNNGTDSYQLPLYITNIGLNSIRKIYVVFEWNELGEEKVIEFSKQDCVNKNQKNKIVLHLNKIGDGCYKLNIKTYYQDLLKNWYEQIVVMRIKLDKKDPTKSIGDSDVQEETIIEDLPECVKEFIASKHNFK